MPTSENVSNGTGKFVTCEVAVRELRSNATLAQQTVLFARGVNIQPEEQATERVDLYNIKVLEPLIQYQEIDTEDGTELIPLEPIIDYKFDLSWEDIGFE